MIECSPATRVESLSCQVDELVILHLDSKVQPVWFYKQGSWRYVWKEVWMCGLRPVQSKKLLVDQQASWEKLLGINVPVVHSPSVCMR